MMVLSSLFRTKLFLEKVYILEDLNDIALVKFDPGLANKRARMPLKTHHLTKTIS